MVAARIRPCSLELPSQRAVCQSQAAAESTHACSSTGMLCDCKSIRHWWSETDGRAGVAIVAAESWAIAHHRHLVFGRFGRQAAWTGATPGLSSRES
jgi:hypothetical protein